MNDVESRLHARFTRQTIMQMLEATMDEAAERRVTIAAPITGHVLQQQEAAHAGLAFSIGDSAAGHAALSMPPPGAEVA